MTRRPARRLRAAVSVRSTKRSRSRNSSRESGGFWKRITSACWEPGNVEAAAIAVGAYFAAWRLRTRAGATPPAQPLTARYGTEHGEASRLAPVSALNERESAGYAELLKSRSETGGRARRASVWTISKVTKRGVEFALGGRASSRGFARAAEDAAGQWTGRFNRGRSREGALEVMRCLTKKMRARKLRGGVVPARWLQATGGQAPPNRNFRLLCRRPRLRGASSYFPGGRWRRGSTAIVAAVRGNHSLRFLARGADVSACGRVDVRGGRSIGLRRQCGRRRVSEKEGRVDRALALGGIGAWRYATKAASASIRRPWRRVVYVGDPSG